MDWILKERLNKWINDCKLLRRAVLVFKIDLSLTSPYDHDFELEPHHKFGNYKVWSFLLFRQLSNLNL